MVRIQTLQRKVFIAVLAYIHTLGKTCYKSESIIKDGIL